MFMVFISYSIYSYILIRQKRNHEYKSSCNKKKSMEKYKSCNKKPIEEFNKLYQMKDEIGRGGFGTVFSAIRLQDKTKVAIKEIYKAHTHIKKTSDGSIPLEIVIMEQLKSVPGVINIIDWYEMPESFFIVMEWCSKDLDAFLNEQEILNEVQAEIQARLFFKQLVTIVQMVHNNGIFHGDIKNNNIVINCDTNQIKLIDFGCSKYLHNNFYHTFNGSDK